MSRTSARFGGNKSHDKQQGNVSISMIVSRAKNRTQTKQSPRFVAEVQLHFYLRIVIRLTEKLS